MASTTETAILAAQPVVLRSSSSSTSDKDDSAITKERPDSEASSLYDVKNVAPLAVAGEEPPSVGLAFLQLLGLKKSSKVYDLDAVATKESVFDGPLASLYEIHPEWENKAVFDPSARWTYREERSIVRKLDLKILLWCCVMFIALDIDRGNLKTATADGILKDVGLTQADYNLGNTLFRVGFLIAELPSQMIGKKIGVDIWLPMQIVIFSILSGAQFWLKGRTMFLAFRFIIAFFQGGFIPDVILYLSYYFTKHELPMRLACFWTAHLLADIITAFLAAGLLRMRGILGYAGWQWMFLIESFITLAVGIASFFLLAPSPSQTKSRLFPRGWFTDREVTVIVNRIVRDDPSKATMHNRQALSFGLLWKSLKDYDLYPLYAIGLTFGIAAYPLGNYFQLSMKGLGFSTLNANLLSVPHTVLSMIALLGLTLLSETVNNRTWVAMIQNWWFLIFYIPLLTLKNPVNPWVWFAIATLILGYPYCHAIQLSGIIGANLYQASDAPRYRKGNTIIISIVAVNLAVIYPFAFFYYRWRNASKEKKWSAFTTEEKAHYLKTTTDEGCKRLDFRFAN